MQPRKMFTIVDTTDYVNVLEPCEHAGIADLLNDVNQIKSDLKSTLRFKLPNIANEPSTHDRPAYLAANQIGHKKRVVLLYLPPVDETKAREIIMINPIYKRLEEVQSDSKTQFRISTFFADQFRFSNRCYADKIYVVYHDEFWNQQSIELKGLEAIAAQMGINFINGITPLDNGITLDELKTFSQNPSAENPLKTARDAYLYHGRAFDSSNPEFDPNPMQLKYINNFLHYRQTNPCLFDPSTGEKKNYNQTTSSTPLFQFN